MSTLPTIDSGTLGWVKSEIEDTALQARELLEKFEADTSDRSAIRLCANYLHQVYGTLTMVELDGAARLVHESETLAQKLADGLIEWKADSGSALRRGIEDLSSYLEGLQSSPAPSPLDLVVSINRVREARGDESISELELFAPDLSARPPEPKLQTRVDASLFLKLADDLRVRFERALLMLLRNPEDRAALNEFSRVFNNLVSIDRRGSLRQLWWIAAGISEAMLDGSLQLDNEIRLVLARINEQLKRLQDKSQAAKRRAPPDELIKRALLILAYCDSGGSTVQDVKKAFGLNEWIRKGAAQGLPDVETLSASLARFASEAEIDLEHAQNLLARYFSPQGGSPDSMERLHTRLEALRVAAQRNDIDVIDRLLEAFGEALGAAREGGIDDLENASLQMAGALLFIQDSGDGIRPGPEWRSQAESTIASLKRIASEQPGEGQTSEPGRSDPMNGAQARVSAVADNVTRAAAGEVRGELQYVEHALEQVAANDAPLANLRGVEPHLKRIEGTLEILEQNSAASLAERLRLAIRAVVESDTLDSRRLDALAMAVGTLGVCADELGAGGSSDRIEETIQRAISELSSMSERPAGRGPVHLELVQSASSKPETDSESLFVDETASNLFEHAPADERHSGLGVAEPIDLDLDLEDDSLDDDFESESREWSTPPVATIEPPEDELVGIFFEEANEIEPQIVESKRRWRADETDEDALGDLRRCFHTLKGSGRFAEATSIAELSWIVEDLLNAVLDKQVAPSESIHEFVDRAHVKVAEMVRARDVGADLDLAPWRREADQLKIGGAPAVEDLAADLGAELLGFSSTPDSPGAGQEPAERTPADERGEQVSEVFREELDHHVATIAESVQEARRRFPNWEISDDLRRTSHTLRGVLRSVGLHAPARMADGLDDLLTFKTRGHHPLEEVDLVLIDQSGRLLRFAANRLGPDLELSTDLALQFEDLAAALSQRLRYLGSGEDHSAPPVVEELPSGDEPEEVVPPFEFVPPPEPSVPVESIGDAEEDELVHAFREEAQEILARLGGQIERWRGGEPSAPILSAMRRELHTFKGGARAVGWMSLGALAHDTETLLEDESLTERARDDVSELVQEVHDVAAVAVTSPPGHMAAEIERLDRRVIEFGESVDTVGAASAPAGVIDEKVPDVAATLAAAPPVAAKPLPPTPSLSAVMESDARAVRVRTEILDELVNFAGEVSILRSRLQQQIQMVKSNLGELGETVRVFRDQLRDLEIESEAQMLATNERIREEGGISEFDPLELDRFTRLQTLSRQLGESLGNLVSIQAGISEFAGDAENTLQQQRHLSEGLQEGLLRTRMISFVSMVPRLRHLTRQTATELGRSVSLEVVGEQVEVDRKVLDQMSASFEHIIRNAVSHGVEDAETRRAAGKSATGKIRIGLEQDGNDIVIRIGDDGRGIDLSAIESRARSLGLLRADQEMSDEDLMRILAAPGLSTASRVTQVAGRGVGMDVVSEMARQLGGSVSVETEPGQGTTFTLRVPVTLAVSHALLVYAGEQMFALPARLIVNVLRIPRADIEAGDGEADAYTLYNDRRIPVLNLAGRLGLPSRPGTRNVANVIIVRAGLREIGLEVESISDTREIVVKPLGPLLQSIPGIGAVTLLGDGSIVLILDVPNLWQTRSVSVSSDTYAAAPAASDTVTVMVVDDSMTVRSVMGRDLQNNGFEVILAKDGVDAIEQLRHAVPDIMLVDLEMPRMDGFELTRRVRGDDHLSQVPILVITSRAGSRHREQAMSLGANGYMSKPYRLDDLVKSIGALTGSASAERMVTLETPETLH